MLTGGLFLAFSLIALPISVREVGLGLVTILIFVGMYAAAIAIDLNGWGWTTRKCVRTVVYPLILTTLLGVGLLCSDVVINSKDCFAKSNADWLRSASFAMLACLIGASFVLQHAANAELSRFLGSTPRALSLALAVTLVGIVAGLAVVLQIDSRHGIFTQEQQNSGTLFFVPTVDLIRDSISSELKPALIPNWTLRENVWSALGAWLLLLVGGTATYAAMLCCALVTPEGSLLLNVSAGVPFVITAGLLYAANWASLPSRRDTAGWSNVLGEIFFLMGSILLIGECGRLTVGFQRLSKWLGLNRGSSGNEGGGLRTTVPPGSGSWKKSLEEGSNSSSCETCVRNDRDLFISREQLQRFEQLDGHSHHHPFEQDEDDDGLLGDECDEEAAAGGDAPRHLDLASPHNRHRTGGSNSYATNHQQPPPRAPPASMNIVPVQRPGRGGPKSSPIHCPTTAENIALSDAEMVNECEDDGRSLNVYGV